MFEKKARISRRRALQKLSAGTFSLLVSREALAEAKKQTKTVEKTIQKTSGQQPPDESSIVADIRPQFKVGQVFKYKSSGKKGKDKKQEADSEQRTPGTMMIKGEAVPLTQTITMAEMKEYKGNKCFLVKRDAIVENPILKYNPKEPEKTAEEHCTTYISETGKILFSESTLILKQGQSTSTSKSQNHKWPLSSTIHSFFGYWMLALSEDFSWESVQETSEGHKSLWRIKVKGLEKINDRDCFVVESLYRTEDQGTTVTRYWVDVKQRVAVRAKKGNLTLERIS